MATTLRELLDKSMNIDEVMAIYKNAISHLNVDEQQGCEELLNSLRDYWNNHLSNLVLTDDEISEAQSTLVKAKFDPQAEAFRNRLLTAEYDHDCKNYIDHCRNEIVKLMAKRKKIPLNLQDVLGHVSQDDPERKNLLEDNGFSDLSLDDEAKPAQKTLAELVDQKLKAIEDDPESLKNFLEQCRLDTRLVAKRYLFVCRLRSVMSEDKDPTEKFNHSIQLLVKNKKLFKDNALKKILVYALVLIAGLVTLPALGYGGYKIHAFFSSKERKKHPLNDERIAEAIHTKGEVAAGIYNRVQGALYDALENRHRWFKIFTNENEAEDRVTRVTELYDTAYMNAKEKHKGKEFGADETSEELEKLLKKELSQENLTDDERFNKFYKAVEEWLPDIASNKEQYKCGTVQRVMLSVLSELRNQQKPSDDYFFSR